MIEGREGGEIRGDREFSEKGAGGHGGAERKEDRNEIRWRFQRVRECFAIDENGAGGRFHIRDRADSGKEAAPQEAGAKHTGTK